MNLELKDVLNVEKEEIFKKLNSSVKGLTDKDAQNRLKNYGLNEFLQKNKKSLFLRIFELLLEPMVIILFIASLFSFLIKDFIEGIVIVGVVIVNTIISLIQESKAEKAVEALKKIVSNQFRVLRNGVIEVINSKFITIGDIIIFEAGDIIPADARVIECKNLLVDESHLTGESEAVNKSIEKINNENAKLYEMKNIVFTGSKVLQGFGKAIVVTTGYNTEMGKIAKNIKDSEEEKTPLQKKLDKEIKFLVGLAFLSAIFVILVVIFKNLKGLNIYIAKDAILIAVTIMVAVFPEGLPASITIALSLAVERLAKQSVIVKKLSSVETFGNVDYICTDKTGTITKNNMTVKEFFINNKFFTLPEIFELIADGNVSTIYDIFLISHKCSTATLEIDENSGNIVKELGDPTETALLKSSFLSGFKNKIFENYKLIDTIPFSSELMYSLSLIKSPDDKLELIGKGAPEKILLLCNSYLVNGEIEELDNNKKEFILKHLDRYSEKGFRLIGFIKKEIRSDQKKINKSQINNFIFIGAAIIYDPPKEEIKEVIKLAKDSNINIVMITGDSKKTGFNIAESIGIADKIEEVIEGKDLNNMTDENFLSKVEQIKVYSRVSPLDKFKIVEKLKKRDHIVAMTGDGINDAPALKKADIGIAMGKAGSQVSQEASEIILTDDNFSTIISAIKEGRNLSLNLKKLVKYLITNNIGKVITVILSPIFGPSVSLTPIQILFTNLIMETGPSVALSIEQADDKIMTKKPIKLKDPIFNLRERIFFIIEGIIFGISITFGYLFVYNYLLNNSNFYPFLLDTYAKFNLSKIPDTEFLKYISKTLAQTVAFLITLLSPQLYIFMLRDGSFLEKFSKPNKLLKLFSIFVIFIVSGALYIPFLSFIFNILPIYNIQLWIVVILCSLVTPFIRYFLNLFNKDFI